MVAITAGRPALSRAKNLDGEGLRLAGAEAAAVVGRKPEHELGGDALLEGRRDAVTMAGTNELDGDGVLAERRVVVVLTVVGTTCAGPPAVTVVRGSRSAVPSGAADETTGDAADATALQGCEMHAVTTGGNVVIEVTGPMRRMGLPPTARAGLILRLRAALARVIAKASGVSTEEAPV